MTIETIKPEPDLNVNELLALHRSIFGDARMEATEESGNDGGAGSEGEGEGSDESGEQSGNEGQSSEESNDGEQSDQDLPEWARERLTKANGEAARYRTRLRELEAKFEGAKSAEEYENAVNELKEENAKLAREALVATVARKYSLPDDLAVRLRGETAEELEQDAKSLRKFVAEEEDPELSGGLNPGAGDDTTDPGELAKKFPRRR